MHNTLGLLQQKERIELVDHQKEQLIKQIQLKQEELSKIGLVKGLNHDDTILISTELDKYIYQLQRMELADK